MALAKLDEPDILNVICYHQPFPSNRLLFGISSGSHYAAAKVCAPPLALERLISLWSNFDQLCMSLKIDH